MKEFKRSKFSCISTNTMRCTVAALTVLVLSITSSYAQSILVDSLVFDLKFKVDKDNIDFEYKDNASVIDRLDTLLVDSVFVNKIDSLLIEATASPEASYEYNMDLSSRRVEGIKGLLTERYPLLEPELFRTSYFVYKWADVVNLMNDDKGIMPNKNEALKILEDTETTERQKEWTIRNHGNRTAWRYIANNYLTQLRHSGASFKIYINSLLSDYTADMLYDTTGLVQPDIVIRPRPIEIIERKPLFAFKTNLLYDALTALNISAEVPIGDKFSIAGEWIFPWWIWDNGTSDSKRHRLQILYGNLEARYWFGDRTDKTEMTGWFAGVYGGAGKYDVEYSKDGVQGEFYSAGLSAGYAHSINKMNTLRMEYSASIGYMNTDYRDYVAMYGYDYDDKWHPVRLTTGEYSYIGPTAVKVSLVWMLYYNKKMKKGGI